MMAANGSSGVDMEKANQDRQQQAVLKCPRCDSSNTKFCYYNNYSLSQPRHFCKACKRYWTRGGSLRNVPVGGGCRKNKRIKRTSAPNNNNTTDHNHIHGSHIDPSSNHVNPLFYGLTIERSLDIPFSRLFSSRGFSDSHHCLGLGFSSSGLLSGHDNYGNGIFNPSKQIQDVMMTPSACNNATTSSSYPMFGSSASSYLHQQKFISHEDSNNFHSLQMSGNNNIESASGMLLKEEKTEGQNWNYLSNHQNQIEQIISSDPSLSWSGGAWLDPPSSVPSLI